MNKAKYLLVSCAALIVLCLPPSYTVKAQAPEAPKAISAYADAARFGAAGYTIQFPNATDMAFTSITAWVNTPSQNCSTVVKITDWSTGASSFPLTVSPNVGPSGSSQNINFTLPAGHAGVIEISPSGGNGCTPAQRINVTAFYR